ncbi:MAG: RnfABCDGE type electron transport complex subunit D [Candidatus Brocadiaceae bacterium]|nr:RnfABCDGE type electron transport complex subunit D [Candidatus Brocadiaceae bacterium]
MESQLVVSSSPHVRHPDSVERIMWTVVAALLPAVAVSLYAFGPAALKVYVLSIVACEVAELACLRIRGRPLSHAADGSALITGLLLAMVLPAGVGAYVPLVGGAFAIAIAKHTFGGLGNNVWNPALVGRIFLQFAYPTQISLASWPVPRALWGRAAADAVTAASPLAGETAGRAWSYLDLLAGNGVPGCIGETCKAALIVGGLFLIARRIIDWRIPVCYIGTVFALTWLLPAGQDAPAWARDPLYHVLSGGLVLGAFFMATDLVTTPVTPAGRAIFAVGCGLLVSLIRRYGGYPEGVAYSIVLMNTATPLIDRWVRPRVYGSRTPKASPRGT